MSFRSPLLVIAAVVAGCYTGSAIDTNAGPWIVTGGDGGTTTEGDGTLPTSAGTPGSNAHGLTHLPCDVEKLLERACWECHGTVPGNDAPSSLVTYDDLMAPNVAIPTMKEIDVSILRMSSVKSPMPPDGKPADADTAVLQKWVDDGMPMGNCGETEVVCTSGKTVSASNGPTALTNPGAACLGCHGKSAKTALTVGGTVYATAREPDDCAGQSNAKVIVIDAKGEAHTLATNASGNFSSTESIPFPYRAMVVRGTQLREMQTPQSNGDCNSCHSANPPTFDAGQVPGRIMMPSATTKE